MVYKPASFLSLPKLYKVSKMRISGKPGNCFPAPDHSAGKVSVRFSVLSVEHHWVRTQTSLLDQIPLTLNSSFSCVGWDGSA